MNNDLLSEAICKHCDLAYKKHDLGFLGRRFCPNPLGEDDVEFEPLLNQDGNRVKKVGINGPRGCKDSYIPLVESQPSSQLLSVDDCLAHRCLDHRAIPPMDKEAECAVCMMKQSQPVIEPLVEDQLIDHIANYGSLDNEKWEMAKELQQFRKAQKDLGK